MSFSIIKYPLRTVLTIDETPVLNGIPGRVLFQNSANEVGQDSVFFWDDANNRLGIGTSSPQTTLDVLGNIRQVSNSNFIIRPATSGNFLVGTTFQRASDGTEIGGFKMNESTGELRFGGLATNYFPTLYSNNTERVRITTTGNVELQGDGELLINRTTGNILKGIRFNNSAGNEVAFLRANSVSGEVRLGGATGGYFPTFYSEGAERARITTTGDLLLGVTSSAGKLTIRGTGATGSTANIDVTNSSGALMFRVRDDSTLLLGSGITNAQLIINSTSSSAGIYSPAYSSGSANIISYKNFSGVSRMTLDMTGSIGLLGINTTAPTHPLTLSSTSMVGGGGIALYSTVDQITNYQRLRVSLTSGNIANYDLEFGGTGTAVGYHSFNLNGTAVLQVDAAQALFGGNLLLTASAGDNTKDIGRRNANPLRFRSMYLGTSAQIGLPADTAIGARMHLGAGTTALPQILLEDGVAPTSPVNGSIWRVGDDIFIRVSGVTYSLNKTAV